MPFDPNDASIMDRAEEIEMLRKVREEIEQRRQEQLERERLRFSKKLKPPHTSTDQR